MLMAIESQELASWIFGGITLLFLLGAFCFGPKGLPEWKRRLLGFLCAVSAGLFGFFFTGAITLKLESEIKGFARIATQSVGGFALFVFVLWWWGRRDKYGKKRNGKLSFDVGPVVSKAIELAEDKGRAEEQIEQLKDELAKAIERIKKLEAEGNRPDAEKALEELCQRGDMMRLQELLIIDRDEHRDALIQRNREIAAVAYLRGDIDIAKEAVNEILKDLPDDLFALNQRGHIYKLRGNLKEAENDYKRVLQLGHDVNDESVQAVAFGNLGVIYRKKGELDKAEEMHLKTLEIEKKLGRLEGLASEYGNLGNVYYNRGELDKADEMYKKSLEINKNLGRLEGMASNYSALGLVYDARGHLDDAKKMHIKGLEIENEIGRTSGMSRQYNNLGLIYIKQGELDKAEEMHLKSLEIEKKLGKPEGMANVYGNLGNVYKVRGDLDKAVEMYLESLKISESREMLELTANQYGNLGLVYTKQGNIGKAREYWEKALDLYKKIGMPHMIEKVEGWIEGIEN